MKKQYILKTLVVIFLVVFALFLAGCTVESDYLYSDISVSEDGKTVTIKAPDESAVDTFRYLGVVPNGELYGKKFYYQSYVDMPDGYAADVFSPLAEKNILYIQSGSDIYCYAKQGDAEASGAVTDFLEGYYSAISFANLDQMRECVLTGSERTAFETVESGNVVENVDVRTLKDNLFYDVMAYDFYGVCRSGLARFSSLETIFTMSIMRAFPTPPSMPTVIFLIVAARLIWSVLTEISLPFSTTLWDARSA